MFWPFEEVAAAHGIALRFYSDVVENRVRGRDGKGRVQHYRVQRRRRGWVIDTPVEIGAYLVYLGEMWSDPVRGAARHSKIFAILRIRAVTGIRGEISGADAGPHHPGGAARPRRDR